MLVLSNLQEIQTKKPRNIYNCDYCTADEFAHTITPYTHIHTHARGLIFFSESLYLGHDDGTALRGISFGDNV